MNTYSTVIGLCLQGHQCKGYAWEFLLYGYYSSQRKGIPLASKVAAAFFHELTHCAHEILNVS